MVRVVYVCLGYAYTFGVGLTKPRNFFKKTKTTKMKTLLLILSVFVLVSCTKKYMPPPEQPKPKYHLLENCVWFKPDTINSVPTWVCTQWKTDTIWDN